MGRAALAILSTEHLLHNLNVIKAKSSGAQIMAMVKANAYGHGIRSVALRLQDQVYAFGVASIDEALALRKVGIKNPITLLEGVFSADELLIASCERFDIVVHEPNQLHWLRKASLPLPLNIWIKVDTGLGRIGFLPEELEKVYATLMSCQSVIKPLRLLSHFACADQPEHYLNKQQIAYFNECIQQYKGIKSLSNSAGIFAFPSCHYDVVRPGISLYGVSPLEGISSADLNLKPVMSLQTRLMAVRRLKKGSTIGYGARFICPEDMPVGVIAMGYGDGYPRTARDGTPILVNGVRCQLVGRVSMDMSMIDLRNCPHAQVNDPVVLWGEGLALEEIASFTGHIPYDMLTAIQTRVKFHWTLKQ